MAKRSPAQDEAWHKNGLKGACGMIRVNAQHVARSRLATTKAKQLADEIYQLTYRLAAELKESTNG